MYWSTGAQFFGALLSVGVGRSAAMNRNWYQGLSTNISIVSVSQTAGWPHLAVRQCFHVG